MDPDASRKAILETANMLMAVAKTSAHPFEARTLELCEAIHDLDGWLRSGGFLPKEWSLSGTPHQPGRKQDVDIEAPRCNKLELHEIGGDIKPRPCPLDLGHQGGHAP